jgi:signal transduction histidine kinase
VFAREDVNEIASGLAEFLAPELAAARVELRLELGRRLPPVRADEGQLRAALLNLLRNSREAMPHGGTVAVTTREGAEGGVEIEIRDTGGGIPAEDLTRIFDPFYSTKEKGTGLGLAFTQQVVKEHGGSIRCESEVGRGTAFTIRLPAAPDEIVVEAPGAEAASA